MHVFDLATGQELLPLQSPCPSPGQFFGSRLDVAPQGAAVGDQFIAGSQASCFPTTGGVSRFSPDGGPAQLLLGEHDPCCDFGFAVLRLSNHVLIGSRDKLLIYDT